MQDEPFQLKGADQLNDKNSYKINIKDSALFQKLISKQYERNFNNDLKQDLIKKIDENIEEEEEDDYIFQSLHKIKQIKIDDEEVDELSDSDDDRPIEFI